MLCMVMEIGCVGIDNCEVINSKNMPSTINAMFFIMGA